MRGARACAQAFPALFAYSPAVGQAAASAGGFIGSSAAEQTRGKKSWSRFQTHEDFTKFEQKRYRREVRKYVRTVPCTAAEQAGSRAPDPPKLNWRRPGRPGSVFSQERKGQKQRSQKPSPGKPSETKRGTRRPENQKASSSCISDTEMKEALAAMLVAAGRFRVGPRTSSPEEKQLWERFDKKPSEFWDIRAKRKTSCSPDFKHKKTLISLWVKNKPDWVSLDAVGHEQQQAVNKSGPAGKAPEKAPGGTKVSFSLRKQFTPLSVDDIRSVLGDDASDTSTNNSAHADSAEHQTDADWQDLAAHFVATEVFESPSGAASKRQGGRAPRHNSKAPAKRWKGKSKKKGGREENLGFGHLREEFPGAWFRGRAHRGPSKENGFPWAAGESRGEEYSSDDDCLSDDEDDVHSHGQHYPRHSHTASQFHADFRFKFWNRDSQRSSGASKQAQGRTDPFTEYIEFKFGAGSEWDFFESFQGPFSEHTARNNSHSFRFTGDPHSGDYTGSYFTGDHTTGTSHGSSQHHSARSQGYRSAVCGETKRHLDVLELQAVPSCPSELKTAYLRQAKKHHPDAAGANGGKSGDSTQQFLQAKTAYEYLQQHCTR